MITQPLNRQQMEYDPNALKDFRNQSENNDPWAVLGNRWRPDAVTMPINTGNLSGPQPLPAVNQQTLANVIANQPRLPTSGYRPGQVPGDTAPFPQFPASAPPAQHSPQLPTQADPRARLATAVMGATAPARPQTPQFNMPNRLIRGYRRTTPGQGFGRNRFGPIQPRPFGG